MDSLSGELLCEDSRINELMQSYQKNLFQITDVYDRLVYQRKFIDKYRTKLNLPFEQLYKEQKKLKAFGDFLMKNPLMFPFFLKHSRKKNNFIKNLLPFLLANKGYFAVLSLLLSINGIVDNTEKNLLSQINTAIDNKLETLIDDMNTPYDSCDNLAIIIILIRIINKEIEKELKGQISEKIKSMPAKLLQQLLFNINSLRNSSISFKESRLNIDLFDIRHKYSNAKEQEIKVDKNLLIMPDSESAVTNRTIDFIVKATFESLLKSSDNISSDEIKKILSNHSLNVYFDLIIDLMEDYIDKNYNIYNLQSLMRLLPVNYNILDSAGKMKTNFVQLLLNIKDHDVLDALLQGIKNNFQFKKARSIVVSHLEHSNNPSVIYLLSKNNFIDKQSSMLAINDLCSSSGYKEVRNSILKNQCTPNDKALSDILAKACSKHDWELVKKIKQDFTFEAYDVKSNFKENLKNHNYKAIVAMLAVYDLSLDTHVELIKLLLDAKDFDLDKFLDDVIILSDEFKLDKVATNINKIILSLINDEYILIPFLQMISSGGFNLYSILDKSTKVDILNYHTDRLNKFNLPGEKFATTSFILSTEYYTSFEQLESGLRIVEGADLGEILDAILNFTPIESKNLSDEYISLCIEDGTIDISKRNKVRLIKTLPSNKIIEALCLDSELFLATIDDLNKKNKLDIIIELLARFYDVKDKKLDDRSSQYNFTNLKINIPNNLISSLILYSLEQNHNIDKLLHFLKHHLGGTRKCLSKDITQKIISQFSEAKIIDKLSILQYSGLIDSKYLKENIETYYLNYASLDESMQRIEDGYKPTQPVIERLLTLSIINNNVRYIDTIFKLQDNFDEIIVSLIKKLTAEHNSQINTVKLLLDHTHRFAVKNSININLSLTDAELKDILNTRSSLLFIENLIKVWTINPIYFSDSNKLIFVNHLMNINNISLIQTLIDSKLVNKEFVISYLNQYYVKENNLHGINYFMKSGFLPRKELSEKIIAKIIADNDIKLLNNILDENISWIDSKFITSLALNAAKNIKYEILNICLKNRLLDTTASSIIFENILTNSDFSIAKFINKVDNYDKLIVNMSYDNKYSLLKKALLFNNYDDYNRIYIMKIFYSDHTYHFNMIKDILGLVDPDKEMLTKLLKLPLSKELASFINKTINTKFPPQNAPNTKNKFSIFNQSKIQQTPPSEMVKPSNELSTLKQAIKKSNFIRIESLVSRYNSNSAVTSTDIENILLKLIKEGNHLAIKSILKSYTLLFNIDMIFNEIVTNQLSIASFIKQYNEAKIFAKIKEQLKISFIMKCFTDHNFNVDDKIVALNIVVPSKEVLTKLITIFLQKNKFEDISLLLNNTDYLKSDQLEIDLEKFSKQGDYKFISALLAHYMPPKTIIEQVIKNLLTSPTLYINDFLTDTNNDSLSLHISDTNKWHLIEKAIIALDTLDVKNKNIVQEIIASISDIDSMEATDAFCNAIIKQGNIKNILFLLNNCNKDVATLLQYDIINHAIGSDSLDVYWSLSLMQVLKVPKEKFLDESFHIYFKQAVVNGSNDIANYIYSLKSNIFIHHIAGFLDLAIKGIISDTESIINYIHESTIDIFPDKDNIRASLHELIKIHRENNSSSLISVKNNKISDLIASGNLYVSLISQNEINEIFLLAIKRDLDKAIPILINKLDVSDDIFIKKIFEEAFKYKRYTTIVEMLLHNLIPKDKINTFYDLIKVKKHDSIMLSKIIAAAFKNNVKTIFDILDDCEYTITPDIISSKYIDSNCKLDLINIFINDEKYKLQAKDIQNILSLSCTDSNEPKKYSKRLKNIFYNYLDQADDLSTDVWQAFIDSYSSVKIYENTPVDEKLISDLYDKIYKNNKLRQKFYLSPLDNNNSYLKKFIAGVNKESNELDIKSILIDNIANYQLEHIESVVKVIFDENNNISQNQAIAFVKKLYDLHGRITNSIGEILVHYAFKAASYMPKLLESIDSTDIPCGINLTKYRNNNFMTYFASVHSNPVNTKIDQLCDKNPCLCKNS